MSDITKLDLKSIRDMLAKRELSSYEITIAFLDRIQKSKKLNAYNTITDEHALKMAKESDERLLKGENRGLEGIPLSVKDLFCTKGVKSTASSKILENFIPPYESTVTKKLFDQGMVMLGKLNNDEFAMGSSNENSFLGPVVNPWKKNDKDIDLVPGGSSGGSAAAVAASLCPCATATDTGGSIRQPASFTGTVGLKPTYGRCSRWGIIAFASSLDQAGPITKTVRDSAILLAHMSGFDEKDSTSAQVEVDNFEKQIGDSIKGHTIGIPVDFEELELSEDIRKNWLQSIEWFKDAGANIKSINLPYSKYALPAYYIIAPAEASSNLARYDGVRYGNRVEGEGLDQLYRNTRGSGFGDEVKRRILMGTYVLSAGYYDAYYLKAQKVRRLIHDDFMKAFTGVDVILSPTTPSTAFGIGENISDPIKMYSNDILTVPVNLAGLPALSVPSGIDKKGLPMGLQLITKHFQESLLFKLGSYIEEARGDIPDPSDWWIKN
tara:strand:+ start:2670 stop:4151 length:1482 start_codon:yes stop_codon:yes gene_type:complete